MKRQWIMDNIAPPKLLADLKELPCSDHLLTHRSEMSLQADPHLRGTHGVPASLQTLWWRAPEVLFGSQTFDQAIDPSARGQQK